MPVDKLKTVPAMGQARVVLHAGDFAFDGAGVQMHTLLGSCVSITLWHPESRLGGMCHFTNVRGRPADSKRLSGRYAEDCLLLFDRAARRHGLKLSQFEGKVFGGGNLLDQEPASSTNKVPRPSLGEINSATALKLLLDRNVSVKVAHVGEFGYRRIVFDLANGDVWVKFKPRRNFRSLLPVLDGRH